MFQTVFGVNSFWVIYVFMYVLLVYIISVNGNWGSWQQWAECSSSCGGGERTRVRLCNSPSPSNVGRPCPGDSSQLARCNGHSCPGEAFFKTQIVHFCDLTLRYFVNSLLLFFLSGGAQKARGSIIGNINDIEFGVAILNATISDSESGGRIIKATITNVPRTLGQFSNNDICFHQTFYKMHQIIPTYMHPR